MMCKWRISSSARHTGKREKKKEREEKKKEKTGWMSIIKRIFPFPHKGAFKERGGGGEKKEKGTEADNETFIKRILDDKDNKLLESRRKGEKKKESKSNPGVSFKFLHK